MLEQNALQFERMHPWSWGVENGRSNFQFQPQSLPVVQELPHSQGLA
jgi:hypothetical protein